jgi:Raf kinase inhibitor-like YbhB/YbcL family protein
VRLGRRAAGCAALLLAGCTGGLGHDLPSTSARSRLTVTSPVFADGDPIPRQFTCDGADEPPPIRWSGATERGSIVVLMTDADADDFVHWLLYNLGGSSGTAGGTSARGFEGQNDFGGIGYQGPCPPKEDSPHHYVITVYEYKVVPSPMRRGERLEDIVPGAAIGEGSLTVTYARP